MKKPYYITTPIYYPSGNWHLGHTYTTVCCDAMARYKRMAGYDVFYLTGTDEHGQKIEKSALEAGQEPKAFLDERVNNIKELWSLLDISYDKFIRTTDEYHKASVQKIFTTLYEKGDIYKSEYKGKYCTPCESFWTATQLQNGKCPDCGREVVDSQEECYFFRLSKYRDKILKLLTESDFLQPQSRVNEMVNNFLKDGLEDIAVSRTTFNWGVKVPFDEKHVIYVWIDALSNYITALGYNQDESGNFNKYWPADLHLMAKEIIRFHSIIWPAVLMALELPLPKKVYGHGWLRFDGDKMSKSKGNVVDPFVLCSRYGVDAIRYYLLREISFGQDCDFSSETMLQRINTDLCNDYGNLVKRSLAMSKQYFGGKITKPTYKTEFCDELVAKMDSVYTATAKKLDALEISKSLESVFDLISSANKYIDNTKPWVLFKEGKTQELNAVIYNLVEAIRIASNMLLPYIQNAPTAVFGSLGLKAPTDFKAMSYGKVKSYTTKEGEALFPRIDIKKELVSLENLVVEKDKKADKTVDKKDNKKDNKTTQCNETQKESDGMITIDEFFKTKLKVASVIACEKVEKADKLLKLTLQVGDETRTVVSGIAKSYTPQEMVGKKVVLVANLKPAKLRGIESQGMILCATHGDKVVLVSPEDAGVESGAEVC